MKRSKNYRAAAELITPGKLYAPLEAVRVAKQTAKAKYDETVEVAFRLGVDPRKADQAVRGTVNLPHGTGKTARVLVFANGDKAEAAREAGADYVGSDDMIEKVSGRLARLRRGRRDARPDGQGRPARQGPRSPWPHAEPEDRHRDDGRRQGRQRHQGRQDRVPRRQAREPPLHHRQGVLRREVARRELRRRARRDPPAQAGELEGPLHREGHHSARRWARASRSTTARRATSSSRRRPRPEPERVSQREPVTPVGGGLSPLLPYAAELASPHAVRPARAGSRRADGSGVDVEVGLDRRRRLKEHGQQLGEDVLRRAPPGVGRGVHGGDRLA